jgi:hypothetical protein
LECSFDTLVDVYIELERQRTVQYILFVSTHSIGLRFLSILTFEIHRSTLEELSVRSNLALDQQKALEDISGDGDFEYKYLCKAVVSSQTDKVGSIRISLWFGRRRTCDCASRILTANMSLFFYSFLLFQDKTTIKLFAALAEAGKQEAALDLMNRLHLEKSLEVCSKYADRLGQTRLAEMITTQQRERFSFPEDDDEGGEQEQESSTYDIVHHQTSSPGAKRKGNNRISPDQNVAKRGRVSNA